MNSAPHGLRGMARAALAGALLAGCSGSGGQSGDAGGGPFIAFAGDFKGFHDWPNQAEATPSPALPAVDAGATADGGVHPGPEREYWNKTPPSGSTTFPIGTIIVKETEEADPTARHVFAMAKRGAGFNSAGALGWEFYELTNKTDGSVSVQWQGYGPTSATADIYGGDPNVCNDCHRLAMSNDYVFGAALQLASF